jgi:hypothetical protein
MRVHRITPISLAVTAAVAFAFALALALAEDARAQPPPFQDPSRTPPLPPQDAWSRLSDEQLGLTPPPSPSEPPAPEPPPPIEPRAPRFGAAGEIVVTGDSTIGVSSTQFSGSDASSFAASFSPGLDVFIVRGLSIGIDVNLGYTSTKGYGADSKLVSTTATTLAGGPRLGLNVPLSELVSWYPRFTFGVESVRLEVREPDTSTFGGGPRRSTDAALFVSAFAPILVHPEPHFFVGAGPGFLHAFGGAQGGPQIGVERTTISGRLVIGGWWGGPPVSSGDDRGPLSRSAPPTSEVPRFGERGQWVFTGELGGAVSGAKRTGGDASTIVSFVPGFDHFFGKRVSAGLSAMAYHGHEVVKTPSGPSTTSDVTSLGLAVRLGIDAPLSSLLSFYPRASLSVARDSYDERSEGQRNDASSTVATLGLYAPLLVHMATHVFAGFGPYVAHDVLRSVDARPGNNLGTRVGASLVVGGWL